MEAGVEDERLVNGEPVVALVTAAGVDLRTEEVAALGVVENWVVAAAPPVRPKEFLVAAPAIPVTPVREDAEEVIEEEGSETEGVGVVRVEDDEVTEGIAAVDNVTPAPAPAAGLTPNGFNTFLETAGVVPVVPGVDSPPPKPPLNPVAVNPLFAAGFTGVERDVEEVEEEREDRAEVVLAGVEVLEVGLTPKGLLDPPPPNPLNPVSLGAPLPSPPERPPAPATLATAGLVTPSPPLLKPGVEVVVTPGSLVGEKGFLVVEVDGSMDLELIPIPVPDGSPVTPVALLLVRLREEVGVGVGVERKRVTSSSASASSWSKLSSNPTASSSALYHMNIYGNI